MGTPPPASALFLDLILEFYSRIKTYERPSFHKKTNSLATHHKSVESHQEEAFVTFLDAIVLVLPISYVMMENLTAEEQRYVYDRCVWESGRAATEIGFWFLGVKGAQVDSSKLTCPLLIISCSEDNITLSKVVSKLTKKYKPSYTYMEIGEHAHFVIREPGWEKVALYIILGCTKM
jgi:pimeloyl-ACP methyl ester carboxylesterase